MKVDVFGDPPRLPQIEVRRGERSIQEVRAIVGGTQKQFELIGDYAAQLTVAELDNLYAVAKGYGIEINDMRGIHMSIGYTSLAQEVDMVQ